VSVGQLARKARRDRKLIAIAVAQRISIRLERPHAALGTKRRTGDI
jgi:hypothetical protein